MRLTVAIPAYRRPAELRRALGALVNQRRPADEVIVVARRDDIPTHKIADEWHPSLPIRLELVGRPGVVEAYNRAFDQASGDLITLMDDDAAPHPDWVRKIIETFEAEPDLAGLGGRDHVMTPDGKWLEGSERIVGEVRWYGRVFGGHHLGYGSRRDVDCLKAVNMTLRKTALQSLRMDPRLRGTGAQWHCELKLCLELRALGKRLAYDPSVLVDHFPAPRFDEDQRNDFNALAYENEIHNLTYALLDYLHPAGSLVLIPYALLIGIWNHYCGVLKGLAFIPRVGLREAWIRTAASARGVKAGWITWRTAKSSEKREPRTTEQLL